MQTDSPSTFLFKLKFNAVEVALQKLKTKNWTIYLIIRYFLYFLKGHISYKPALHEVFFDFLQTIGLTGLFSFRVTSTDFGVKTQIVLLSDV